MTDKNTNSFEEPPVKDKRVIPPGILPKSVRAWMLGGIAAVMIVVIAFSGRNAPKQRVTPPIPNAVIDPNAERIHDFRKDVEEKTRQLEIEQAEFIGKQQALMSSEAERSGSGEIDTYRESSRFAPTDPSPERALEAEKEKRDYQSLFASNVAASYRKETPSTTDSSTPSNSDELARMLSFYSALATMQGANSRTVDLSSGLNGPRADATALTAVPIQKPNPSEPLPSNEYSVTDESQDNKSPQLAGASANAGRMYRIFEGTVIETVLTNRLDGSFSGPVNCMVTTNFYTPDGQHLLIPQGSRVLGEVRKVETFGQQRLAVFFHRIIVPNGHSISLDRFTGLNQIGETGLRDKVNHHYLQIFGVSLAIGAIAGTGQATARTGFDQSGLDAYQQGVASSLSQSSMRILDRYLSILPTFTIREGHRVKVYLSQDLVLPAYDKYSARDGL